MYRPPSPSKSNSFLDRTSPQAPSPSVSHARFPHSSPSPAQRGAVLAFSSPPPLVHRPTLSTSPGALAAAVKAGSPSPSATTSSPALAGSSSGRHYSMIAGRGAMQRNGSNETKAGVRVPDATSSPAAGGQRTQSPSHIAATRAAAASRAAAATSGPPVTKPLPRRPVSLPRQQSLADGEGKDESHIAETSSLVELFEAKTTAVRRQSTVSTLKAGAKRAVTVGNGPTGIVSPIPLRPRPMSLEVKADGLPNLASPDATRNPRPLPPKWMPTDAASSRTRTGATPPKNPPVVANSGPKVESPAITRTDPPALPPPRRAKTQSKPSRPAQASGVKPAPITRREVPDLLTGSPPPPSDDGILSSPPLGPTRKPLRSQAPILEPTPPRSQTTTLDPPKPRPPSAAPAPPPPRSSGAAALPQRPVLANGAAATTAAVPTLPSPGPLRPQRSGPTRLRPGPAPSLTADTLASAIVASSLASSRGPSPAPRPALPPRHPSSPSAAASPATDFAHLLARPAPPAARAPSPRKPPTTLRQTLRRRASSAEELRPDPRGGASRSRSPPKRHGGKPPKDDRFKQHHHAFLVRRHPNKHAEGARRRWQDAVGEAERKRYEGVWASNRGILMQTLAPPGVSGQAPPASGDEAPGQRVHALVVKDLWSRSGLSARLLAEVWELVRGGGGGGAGEGEPWQRRSLRRDEFVVGMWLVDQCLKGRKLPVEVGESVWASVRGLSRGLAAR